MLEPEPFAVPQTQAGRRQARILANLNPQQHAVVTAGEGPILVVAGAGSGKTTALTRRVAYLIDQSVRPESILLLTFTRAAAQSMLARAVGLTEEAERVVGGTFHAFSAQILREAHAAFGLPRNFSILDPGDVTDAIKRCVADVPLEDPSANKPQASTIAKIISFSANTGDSIAKATAAKSPEWIARNDWIESVRKHYVRYKLDRGLLDYDDLLIYLGHLLEDADLGPQVRNRFSHILVDEHQDSNHAQLRIVYGLGGKNGNVLAVGDPAQAIYPGLFVKAEAAKAILCYKHVD